MLKIRIFLFVFLSFYHSSNSSKIADITTDFANAYKSVVRLIDNIQRIPMKDDAVRNAKDIANVAQTAQSFKSLIRNATSLRDNIMSLKEEMNKIIIRVLIEDFSVNGSSILNASEIIRNNGFACEEHTVTTEDGYVLRLFRIPGNGSAVLIIHGLLNSADNWLGLGKKSLPFQLANQGYDVWLGNSRGNRYSRLNTHFSPEDPRFFNFSWHEMGVYDSPAMIDYILATTGTSKLSYIGHSQGTTVIYVTLSEIPEYNKKLDVVVSLAPISFISNGKSPLLQVGAVLRRVLDGLFKVVGYEIAPFRPPLTTVAAICGSSKLLSVICISGAFLFYGFDYDQIDYDFVQYQLLYITAGSSFKQILHFFQNCFSEGFNKFDHGLAGNIEQYGSVTPPAYAVDKITAKNVLIWGKNDWLADPIDVERLKEKLPNVESYQVMFDDYNHADFLWARDTELVYPKIIDAIRTYT